MHDTQECLIRVGLGGPCDRPSGPSVFAQLECPFAGLHIHAHAPLGVTDPEGREVIDVEQLSAMAEAEPVLLGLSWADTDGQGHLFQTPVLVARLAPHMENLVRSIIGIGLRGSEKLHLVRILGESAVLYSADVVVALGELGVDCNLLQGRRIVPSGFARNIH